jgi:hypothetical protein
MEIGLQSKQMVDRQMATALYFIDKLALRAGSVAVPASFPTMLGLNVCPCFSSSFASTLLVSIFTCTNVAIPLRLFRFVLMFILVLV